MASLPTHLHAKQASVSSSARSWAVWGEVPFTLREKLISTLDSLDASLLLLGDEAQALEQAVEVWQGQLSSVRWHVVDWHNAQQDDAVITHRVGALQGCVIGINTAVDVAALPARLQWLCELQSTAKPLPIIVLAGSALWRQVQNAVASAASQLQGHGLRCAALCASPLTAEAVWNEAWQLATQQGGCLDVSGMSPLSQLLGMELQAFADGVATVQLHASDAVRNSFGVAHGGALMSLMDVAMAMAARSFSPHLGVVTIEMKSSFMRAADVEQGHLQAVAKVLHRTASLAFCEVSVLDAKGQVCAHGTGTFKVLSRLVSSQRKVYGLQNAAD